MAGDGAGTSTVEGLTRYLFDSAVTDDLADEIAGWMAGSRRFRSFVEAHRDKVRKKLRGAADAEMRRDLRAELLTAHLLLAERGVELAFEPYGAAKGGPDFGVLVDGARFNLEVTRLRATADDAHLAGHLLAKLRQLPPSAPNAVLIAVGRSSVAGQDLATVVRDIRRRADAKDEAFFVARDLTGSRDFYQRFPRLGGIFLFAEAGAGPLRASLWANPSARIALPARAARTALSRLHGG